jgi:hypothetical protein
MFRSIV